MMPVERMAGKSFTVVIDAGHGGKDPGAKGRIVNEKDINLAVALKLGQMIATYHNDVKVIYTRQTDKFIELDERAEIANKNKADLFISIHTNSLAKRNSAIKGTETYTLGLARNNENLDVAMRENSAILLEDNYQQRYEGFDPNSSESYIIFEFIQSKHVEQSVSFASEVQKSFTAAKRQDRGVRQAGFLVLRKTSMPSVLIELGYITNSQEEQFLKSDNGRKQMATSIYNAFTKYKRDYDRKMGALGSHSQAAPLLTMEQEIEPSMDGKGLPPAGSEADIARRKHRAAPEEPETETVATPTNSSRTVYKIQILTSPKKLPEQSSRFKGYKQVSYYVENGIYKYTYGESTHFNEIRKLRRSILKDFKDAFIIEFKDGKKINKE
ncbi:MAG: N-acetylmuramoyl-L-alanine amidase [Parabacteroides sp.]